MEFYCNLLNVDDVKSNMVCSWFIVSKQSSHFFSQNPYRGILIIFGYYRERKCADTIGTVLGSLGWPFPMLKYKHIFQLKYTEEILSNSTRKLLWFEISKMLIAV